MAMIEAVAAFNEGRRERAAKHARTKKRKSFLSAVAGSIGKYAPEFSQVRTIALQLAGLGCIDYAMFEWSSIAGFISSGVSLILLDYVSGIKEE